MIPLRDNLRCSTFPFATVILIALNCLIFLVEISLQATGKAQNFFNTFTMIPGKVTHAFAIGDPHLITLAIISIFTAMFLHGGWMHLIGNMLYLYAFGRGMEGRLGWLRYTLFYFVAGVAATAMHIASDPTSMVQTLGASGAIAGVLGGYLVLWPQARITGILIIGILPLKFTARAYWWLIVWFASQLSSVIMSLGSIGVGDGVAYWAHVGGFAFGLIFAGCWRIWGPKSDVCYIESDCTPCKAKKPATPELDDDKK